MALEMYAIAVLLGFITCTEGAGCKIDSISIDSNNNIWATSGGFYAGVKPEKVLQKKTPFPAAMAAQGFATVDAFDSRHISFTEEGKQKTEFVTVFTKGSKYIQFWNENGKDRNKTFTFPDTFTKAGFTRADGFTMQKDGGVCIAMDGYFMCANDKVTGKKTPFPKEITALGFTSIDGMSCPNDYCVFLKGAEYVYVGQEDGKDIAQKGPIPSILTDNGFTHVSGFSITENSDPAQGDEIWVAKNGHFMGVQVGEVIQAKAPLPGILTDKGFDTIDAFHHFDTGDLKDTSCFSKGGHFMCVKDDTIVTPKTAFDSKLIAKGFTSADGLSFTDADSYCMAKGNKYICEDKTDEVSEGVLPKAFTDAGFDSVDGWSFDKNQVMWVVKGAYWMAVGEGGKIVHPKTPLPSTLAEALCYTDTSVFDGSINLTDSGATPKQMMPALKKTLAAEFAVDASLVTVKTTDAGKYTYKIAAPSNKVAKMQTTADALKKSPATFAPKLATELKAKGVAAAKADAVTASGFTAEKTVVTAQQKPAPAAGGDSVSASAMIGASVSLPTFVTMLAFFVGK